MIPLFCNNLYPKKPENLRTIIDPEVSRNRSTKRKRSRIISANRDCNPEMVLRLLLYALYHIDIKKKYIFLFITCTKFASL